MLVTPGSIVLCIIQVVQASVTLVHMVQLRVGPPKQEAFIFLYLLFYFTQ